MLDFCVTWSGIHHKLVHRELMFIILIYVTLVLALYWRIWNIVCNGMQCHCSNGTVQWSGFGYCLAAGVPFCDSGYSIGGSSEGSFWLHVNRTIGQSICDYFQSRDQRSNYVWQVRKGVRRFCFARWTVEVSKYITSAIFAPAFGSCPFQRRLSVSQTSTSRT